MASYSSWKPYTNAELLLDAPTDAGNYLIRVPLQIGGHQIIYAGQASNLYERLADHLMPSEKNKRLRDHVEKYDLEYCWIIKSKQEDRDNEESSKIEKYDPPCNIQHP